MRISSIPLLRGIIKVLGENAGISGVLQSVGVSYLLNDTFTTDRAAGAVNGTAAEPGPGTRTVVDTGNRLSISSARAAFAGGPGNWTGLVLAYPSVTRAAGRLILGSIYITATNNFTFGFDTEALGTNELSSAWFTRTTDNLNYLYYAGTSRVMVDAATLGAYYQVAIILRAQGFVCLVKKASSTWNIYYVDATDNTATMYPGIVCAGSDITTNYCDYIKIPTLLWLPTPLLSDGCGGTYPTTDGLGHAEGVAGGLGAGGGGLVWQTGNPVSTWSYSGGKLVNTPNKTVIFADSGLEGNYTGGICDSLTDRNGIPTCLQSVDVHGGSKAQYFEPTVNSQLLGVPQFASVANRWYSFGCWYKTLTDNGQPLVLEYGNTGWGNTQLSTGPFAAYTKIAIVKRAVDASTTYFRPVRSVTAAPWDISVFDDVDVTYLTLNELFTTIDLSKTDVYASGDLVVTAGTQAGLVVNLDSKDTPANFIIAYHDGTNAKLEKCVAGTYTSVVSAAAAYGVGKKIVVRSIGTSYYLFYGDAYVGSGTIADAAIRAATRHGVFSTYSGNTIDNIAIYATGTSGEYNYLDQFTG